MGFMHQAKKYIDKDPKRLFLYLIDVQPEKKGTKTFSKVCDICDKNFTLGTLNHCRICQRTSCNLCVCRYHFPKEFDDSFKDFDDYVCLICRDQLLLYKQQITGAPANLRRYRNYERDESGGLIFLPPQLWAPKDLRNGSCFQCGKKIQTYSQAHNCRVCGEIVDDRCSLKMKVPHSFERKGAKRKKHKQRVCVDCRFYLVMGVKMREGPVIEFNTHSIEENWANRVIPESKLEQRTLYPHSIRISLNSPSIYPETPHYIIEGLSNSFKSPDVKIESFIDTVQEDSEEPNGCLVVSLKIKMSRVAKGEDEKETASSSNAKETTALDNLYVKEEENSLMNELVQALSRESTKKKLRKVQINQRKISYKQENSLEKALKSRMKFLAEEFESDDEEDNGNWKD